MNPSEIVRKIYLFSTLTPGEHERVASSARVRETAPGDVVCREGEPGSSFFAVGSGSLEVRKGEPPVRLATLLPGQYFGEMALLTNEARTATVVAVERSQLLEIDRRVLVGLFQTNPGLAQSMSKLVASRRRHLIDVVREEVAREKQAEEESGRILNRMRKVFGLK